MNAVIILLMLFEGILSDNDKLEIAFLRHEISVDGKIESSEWDSVKSYTGLIDPWVNKAKDNTIFKCFVTNDKFFFCFDVTDTTMVTSEFEGEMTVAKEDRVEIFFSSRPTLEMYYCIEIDPYSRILDYSARYYRNFNESWDFETLKTSSTINSNGYKTEGSIDLSELKKLGMNNPFYLGVFRADFLRNGTDKAVWYTLKDPKVNDPDFHIPSAFIRSKFLK